MARSSRPRTIFPICLRDATVSAITDVSPHVRRLTLTGDDLGGGPRDGVDRPPFRSLGFDDHVKIVIPDADGTVVHPGTQQPGRVDWAAEALERARDYTVRRWSPGATSFDIDVVRHDGGRASDWAFRATVGSTVTFAGPKVSELVSPEATWHLLIADETGLPAVGRWLEEAPEGHLTRVIVEVPTEADIHHLATRADAEITWLVRPPGVSAGHSTQLFEAVREFEPWPGRGFAWGAGEAMTLAPIRRWLRRDGGMAAEDVDLTGYWRRTEVAVDADPDSLPPSHLALAHELHELTELMPPIVIRVAATLDVAGHIHAGSTTVTTLADRIGVSLRPLEQLLAAMSSLGLLRRSGEHWTLTSLGELLTDDDTRAGLDLDDPTNSRELALVDLLEVVRSGRASSRGGATVSWEDVDDRAADRIGFEVDHIAALPVVAAARSVTVVGPGAASVASTLLSSHPHHTVSVCCPPGHATAVDARVRRGRAAAIDGRFTVVEAEIDDPVVPFPSAEVVVGLHLADAVAPNHARAVLTRMTDAATTHVVLLSRTGDDRESDDHTSEASLIALTTTGHPLPTSSDLVELLDAAGAVGGTVEPLGWGFGSRVATATPRSS